MTLSVAGRGQLATFINPDEVLLSGTLIERAAAAGINRDRVRQWMHRTSPKDQVVWRSNRLILPGGERLFARKPYVGTAPFLQRVVSLLDPERPGVARAIRRLLSNGVVLRAEAEKLLATPVRGESTARFCDYDADVVALSELGAGMQDGENGTLERIVKPQLLGQASSHALALRAHGELLLQSQITRVLIYHFRRQGLIAWNGYTLPEVSGKWVDFNGFAFNASAHSWLTPLLRWSAAKGKPRPTPVVVDVYVRKCDEGDVEGFVQRIARARGNPRSGLSILGVLAAPDFAKPAWSLSKENGFLTINLHDLFGDTAIKAMEQVRDLLSYVSGDPGRAEAKDMENLAATLDQLKHNPYVSDLRSIALEMWAALALKADGWEDVQTNLTVPFGLTTREIDASGSKDARSKVYLIECKAEGAKKELAPDYVQKFFEQTVPAFVKERCVGTPSSCRAEIWTTGIVGRAAMEQFKQLSLKPYVQPKLVGGEELEAMVPVALRGGRRLLKAVAVA